jgi:hypothetical protein
MGGPTCLWLCRNHRISYVTYAAAALHLGPQSAVLTASTLGPNHSSLTGAVGDLGEGGAQAARDPIWVTDQRRYLLLPSRKMKV